MTRLPFFDTPAAVLKFVRREGWPVTKHTDHWRVTLPSGDYLTIPQTTSRGLRVWASTNQKLRRAMHDRI
jgi:hypothetical protein